MLQNVNSCLNWLKVRVKSFISLNEQHGNVPIPTYMVPGYSGSHLPAEQLADGACFTMI